MAGRIDEAQVRHVARLARLKLSDEEVRVLAGQLGEILDYVRQLDALDTTGVEPLAHVLPVKDVLRDDEPGETLSSAQALANAPARAGPLFRVPKVLDQNSQT